MKKFFFLACLLLATMVTFAAEVKKVAILEVVDKESRLSYSQKLVLRSNLEKAITNTSGYEAYDRTATDAIMSEHEFQRTGMVSNDQIKKLGEMAGVKLILVAEGALTGDNKMFVAVKVLDVETAKVVMTDNTILGLSSEEMKSGCEQIANNLFAKKSIFGKKKQAPVQYAPQAVAVTTVAAQPVIQNQQAAKAQAKQVAQPAQPAKPQYNNMVTRISRKEYVYQGISMDKKGYEKFLASSCTPAYKQYRLGKKLTGAGWGCAVTGVAFIIIGAPMLAIGSEGGEDDGGIVGAGSAFIAIGAIAAVTSIPLFTIGSIKKKKSVDTYNYNCASAYNTIDFKLTAGSNGLGIAMNF